MATLHQQIRELERDAELASTIRAEAKTEGGRLTPFGKDLLHAFHNNNIPNALTARVLGVTPAAVNQNVSKLTARSAPKPKRKTSKQP
jgi:hypothetical protein